MLTSYGDLNMIIILVIVTFKPQLRYDNQSPESPLHRHWCQPSLHLPRRQRLSGSTVRETVQMIMIISMWNMMIEMILLMTTVPN